MKDYAKIYEGLPIQEGYTYYRLSELVDNLEILEDTSGWYMDLPTTEIRYIRPSYLRGDYRNCEIEYDSITKAPFMSGSYRSHSSPITTHLVNYLDVDDIYDTKDNYGGYAAFIDGQIKVGKISTHNKQIPIARPIAHFIAKANGAAMTDYILRELTSDYALKQALQIQRLYNNVSRFDLYQIMIAVPSIDRQDEILASEVPIVTGINDDERTDKDQLDDLVSEIMIIRHNINQVWARKELWRQQRKDGKKYTPFVSSDEDPILCNCLKRECMSEADYKAFSSALYQLYYEGSHAGNNLPLGFAPRQRWWDDKTPAIFPQLVMLNRHYFNHRNFEPSEAIELTDDDLFNEINGGKRPKERIEYKQMQYNLLRKCVDEMKKMQEYLEKL